MGLFNDWVCPNIQCENDKPGESNGFCSECGTKLKALNRKQIKAQKQAEKDKPAKTMEWHHQAKIAQDREDTGTENQRRSVAQLGCP